MNERDLKKLKVLLVSDESKEAMMRLFNEALLESTMITAPEIKKCLRAVENKLSDKKEKVVIPNRVAE